MHDFKKIHRGMLRKMSKSELTVLVRNAMDIQDEDKKENAIVYYEPASKNLYDFHRSTTQTISLGGGNGSSKSEASLAEMIMCCTGRIPESLQDPQFLATGDPQDIDETKYLNPLKKLRGPINCRIVCESLTTVLEPIILPKLQWWKWTGVDEPGGKRGHWGWIPKDCLIDCSWDRSWKAKTRMLKILYRDPFQNDRVVGESTIQCMSRDQDASDFASGDFHMVLHDEPPTFAIWRENQARTMRVRGRMMLAMTWPDDPAIAVDWLFDEVYEPATRSNKDPNIDWINLFTTDNKFLDQGAVALQMSQWSDEVRMVRIQGQPIRFSNRVHPMFTDQEMWWCFGCGKTTSPVKEKCSKCESSTIASFNHVGQHDPVPGYPTIWMLDPHPRKPHMYSWWQVTPQDDLVQVMEGECEGDPIDVAMECDRIETAMGLDVRWRWMDPNMGRSPASTKRGITWQDEFESAGLHCDLADDSEVGRRRIDELLRPDKDTLTPRILISNRCVKTIRQMKRYVWDDYKQALEKGIKQTPKNKEDDFPTLMKYLVNTDPGFRFLQQGALYLRRPPPPTNNLRTAARMR